MGRYATATGAPAWLWAWLASMAAELRAGSHVVDLTAHPGPGEHLREEWQPVAEHPQRPVYLVRRCP
jgi:hypothetical protein